MISKPVAVDAMGGDHAPNEVVAGALRAVALGVPVCLVGDVSALRPLVGDRLPIRAAAQPLETGDIAAQVRRASQSSVRVMAQLIRAGEACAGVTCGDTGAALVASVLDIGLLAGVERPGIASLMPRTDGGRLVLLDAGANVDCRPEMLVSFAELGVAYATTLGVTDPRVGVLSNGEEATKGNQRVRATLALLEQTRLHFVGQVEPHQAIGGACDVLVCDGFVGNIMLKAAEAVASAVLAIGTKELSSIELDLNARAVVDDALQRVGAKVSWGSQGGAPLLGCDGVVIVGHGRASRDAVCAAIQLAHQASEAGLVGSMRQRLRKLH